MRFVYVCVCAHSDLGFTWAGEGDPKTHQRTEQRDIYQGEGNTWPLTDKDQDKDKHHGSMGSESASKTSKLYYWMIFEVRLRSVAEQGS